MAKVHCPQCGKPNPEELDICQFCGGQLKPTEASTPAASHSIHAGEEPVKKNTAEFDKVTLSPSEKEPIHPGEPPTKKNTAELEHILPSWLRNLRGKQEPAAEEPPAEGGEPPVSAKGPTLEPAETELPDWIAGIGSAANEDEEEVPDWLSSLRSGGLDASSSFDSAPAPEPGELVKQPTQSNEPPQQRPQQQPSATGSSQAAPSGLPDWLQELQAKEVAPADEQTTSPQESDAGPGWLSSLPSVPIDQPETQADKPGRMDKPEPVLGKGEANQPPASSASVPVWLSEVTSEPEAEKAAPAADVPDWLSKLEIKAGTDAEAASSPFVGEPPVTPQDTGGQLPDWLTKLQAELGSTPEAENKPEAFEEASAPPAEPTPRESLPDWLSNLGQAAPPSTETPALIVGSEEKSTGAGEDAAAAFSLETPDWLSKLKPEQGSMANQPAAKGEAQSPESLQPADLPSWVQAMRPVEAVVDQTKATPADENQVTEEHGPLAGLRAVLPSEPGLGPLRKPPAYSFKLQTTDTQQRYAAHLEKLISSEVEPRSAASSRTSTGGWLRLLIAALLILFIGVPIVSGLQITPSEALYPPEMSAEFNLISNNLPANAPVLVAFDYEPALSGELEAAGVPVIDHLLLKGARLTFISTIPTGPVLADHFMLTLQAQHKDQTQPRIVNLGFLAGGPAGVLAFADDPGRAAPYTKDGISAWQTASSPALPSLQGI